MAVRPCSLRRAAAQLALLFLPATALAQDTIPPGVSRVPVPTTALVTIGGVVDERIRFAQLVDTARPRIDYVLRSASSATPRLEGPAGTRRWAVILPEVAYLGNFELPYSLNDGPLWAGRGTNLRAVGGLTAEWGPVRLILAPELLYSQNQPYQLANPQFTPPLPPGRSQWANPWHRGPYPFSIDLPLRFGDRPIGRLDPGQSSIAARAWKLETGAATENNWWGPGVRNALVLSSNAPGWFHLFLRTATPIETPIGAFSTRWLAGVLEESDFFDSDASNDTRSISALGLAWQPWFERNLTLGATRSVYSRATGRGDALADFSRVFTVVGQPSGRPLLDASLGPGRDQVLSLFARWVLPADGFEAYAEWGRSEEPVSLRDFLVQPNHTQAYTIGLQWAGPEVHPRIPYPGKDARWHWLPLPAGRVRVRGEFTSLEQSTTFRLRTTGTWYTSDPVVQGYTNRGQSLGAAIGPGSSGQFLSLDYVTAGWEVGTSLERTRWMEDAHSLQAWPDGAGGWCEHDVALLHGFAGSVRTRYGTFAGTWSSGWRLNVFFNYVGGCPNGQRLDIRQHSLALTFSPNLAR